MEKVNIYDNLIGIAISFIMLCILAMVTLMIISDLSPTNLCQSWCEQNNGTYWIATDCNGDTLACSGFCTLQNETLYCQDILENITTAISCNEVG